MEEKDIKSEAEKNQTKSENTVVREGGDTIPGPTEGVEENTTIVHFPDGSSKVTIEKRYFEAHYEEVTNVGVNGKDAEGNEVQHITVKVEDIENQLAQESSGNIRRFDKDTLTAVIYKETTLRVETIETYVGVPVVVGGVPGSGTGDTGGSGNDEKKDNSKEKKEKAKKVLKKFAPLLIIPIIIPIILRGCEGRDDYPNPDPIPDENEIEETLPDNNPDPKPGENDPTPGNPDPIPGDNDPTPDVPEPEIIRIEKEFTIDYYNLENPYLYMEALTNAVGQEGITANVLSYQAALHGDNYDCYEHFDDETRSSEGQSDFVKIEQQIAEKLEVIKDPNATSQEKSSAIDELLKMNSTVKEIYENNQKFVEEQAKKFEEHSTSFEDSNTSNEVAIINETVDEFNKGLKLVEENIASLSTLQQLYKDGYDLSFDISENARSDQRISVEGIRELIVNVPALEVQKATSELTNQAEKELVVAEFEMDVDDFDGR